MFNRLFFLIAFTACLLTTLPSIASPSGNAAKSNLNLFMQLDSILDNHQYYIDRKEARLASLKSSLSKAGTDKRRLDLLRSLYEEYKIYDSDSALHYATRASKTAERLYRPDSQTMAMCRIDEAYILGILGFFEEALMRLENVDQAVLDTETRIRYFLSAEYIHSMRSLYLQGCRKQSEGISDQTYAYRDSLLAYADFSHPELLWIPVAADINGHHDAISRGAIEALLNNVESSDAPGRVTATNAYWLAHYYENKGDEEKWIRYLTIAAINDAKIENREIAAITELADWLFSHDDRTRAYNYYVYSSRQSNSYHNRNRLLNLAEKLAEARDAYDEDVRTHNRNMRIILIVLLVLTIVLIVMITLFIKDNNRLKHTRKALSTVNSRLKQIVMQRDEAIATLEQANRRLSESNDVKRGVLALTFQLTTHYINMLDDYRKKLLRKYKLKQYSEIGAALENSELTKDQYREFYNSFDRTILSIFPDFVNEFNADAPDDMKVDAETVERTLTLNTRMRVHALRRLGVDKSAEIAKMLNVSIRTVYNNRNTSQIEPGACKI